MSGCASTPDAEDGAQAEKMPATAAGESPATAVPVEEPAPVAVAAPVEGRRVADVQAAFAARQASLRWLNSNRASQNAGKIVVSFVVAPNGQVVECRLISSDFQDPAFNKAVFAEVWRLYLGERDVGEWAVNDYPVEFAPREAAQGSVPSGSSAPLGVAPAAPVASSAAPAG
ncbi:hypothetical protein B1810_09130 [Panacagrimonas perspica]|nr:hypothetical protein B1810_09130 [Panacagrimonas perspica]